MMDANQSLQEALEPVQGPDAERNLDARISRIARGRGGMVMVTRRVSFGDGSSISWTRQPGKSNWIKVDDTKQG